MIRCLTHTHQIPKSCHSSYKFAAFVQIDDGAKFVLDLSDRKPKHVPNVDLVSAWGDATGVPDGAQAIPVIRLCVFVCVWLILYVLRELAHR